MKKWICAAVLAACVPAMAAEEWIEAASTDGMSWSIKPGSFSRSMTKGRLPIASVIGRSYDKNQHRIEIQRWYVPLSDCAREMGEIVTLNMKGAFLYSSDFAYGAGSVNSILAETICRVFEMSQAPR